MSRENISLLTLTEVATEALTHQRFVSVGGVVATAAGYALGVARTDGAIGEAVPVDALGTALVTAGGAVTKGDAIEVGTAGKAVTHSAGTIVARSLADAAADGDVIEVLLVTN